MIVSLVLIGYAAAAAYLGPWVLTRARWAVRSPRSGVLAWQALSTSVLLTVLLAAVTLALPFLPLRFPLADLLGAHPLVVVEHYGTPLGLWPGVLGLLVVAGCLVLLARATAHQLRNAAVGRRAQRETLLLVGHPHPEGFTVVDHTDPAAYCVPGHPGTVVLTSGALAILTEQERRLVLGHEHRHLRDRHHLALAYSGALALAFGRVPLFAEAHHRIATLVEMAADDVAHGRADRRALARALVALSTGERPEAALGAGDTAALERVRRLVRPLGPSRPGQGLLVGLAAAAALSIPVTVAAAPAIEAAARECCTVAMLTARH